MWMFVIAFFAVLVAYAFTDAGRVPPGFPPGPRLALPMVGCVWQLGTDLNTGAARLHRKFGDVVGFRTRSSSIVLVTGFHLLKEMADSPIFADRPFLNGISTIVGGSAAAKSREEVPGILFSSGSNWAKQRRFTLNALRDLGLGRNAMEEAVASKVAELCQDLRAIEGAAICPRGHFVAASLSSLWAALSSKELDRDDSKFASLICHVDTIVEELSSPLVTAACGCRPLSHILEALNFFKTPEAIRAIESFVLEEIEEHEATYQEDNIRDFVDMYLREIRACDKEEALGSISFKGDRGKLNLVMVLIDLFITGSETTTSTLRWAMLFLLEHPNVQRRAQAELDAVTGRGARLPQWKDRARTPYLQAVIHEVQRCGNITSITAGHAPARDARLPGRGRFSVPRDSYIIFNYGAVMSDPASFPDPEKFDPDRYLKEDGSFEPHPRVIPYGLGRRRCVGDGLAKVSLYLFLAGILSHFDLQKENECDELDLSPRLGLTLSPKPFKLRFVPRR